MNKCVICTKECKNKTCSTQCNKKNLSNMALLRFSNKTERDKISDAIKNKWKNPVYREKTLSKSSMRNPVTRELARLKRIETINTTDYKQKMSLLTIERYKNNPELKAILSHRAKNRTPEHKEKLSIHAKERAKTIDTTIAMREWQQKNKDSISERQLGMSIAEWKDILHQIKNEVENKKNTVSQAAISRGLSQKTVCNWFHKMNWSYLIDGHINNNQLYIFNWLKTQNLYPLLNDRQTVKPKELDIYINNLGIEVNGLYWHSSANKYHKRQSHMDKYFICQNKGIQLMALYDDELKNSMELIKAMILHRLGKSGGSRIGARKLNIKEVDVTTAKDFFKKFHLDGYTNAKKTYGLFLEDKLISAMSIRTYVGSGYRNSMEIARFATDYHYIVSGAASRLVNHIQLVYKKDIVSYSNNRISSGDVYRKSGFIEHTVSRRPSYWYTDLKTRVFRTKCRKNNDKTITNLYPTEELQALNGIFSKKLFGDNRPLYRIEDYGHRRWIKKYNKR